MKNITRKLNILVAVAILFVPFFAFAQYDYGYSDYSYDYGYSDYGYSDYGYNDYSNYDYGYSDYSSYDYGYNDYSNYDYGYNDYSYDYGYNDYSYDYGYNDYNYDYGYNDYNYDYGYNDYSYDYGYNDYSYDYGYNDYNYDYGYNDYNYDYGYNDYSTGYDDSSSNYGYNDYSTGNSFYDSYDSGSGYSYGGGCSYGSNCGGYSYNYNSGCSYGNNCGGSTVVINQTNNLSVICSVSDTNILAGETTRYTANVSGGNGTITYSWSGDFTSTLRTFIARIANPGTYDASVTVRDSANHTATANCANVVVTEVPIPDDPIAVTCSVSDTNLIEGESVRYTANITGGNGSVTYDWNGSFDSNARTFLKQILTAGSYPESVTVRDSSNHTATANCQTVVVTAEPLPDDPISVTCSVSDTNILAGETTRYTANVSGGNGSVTYSWSGDFTSTLRTFIARIANPGTYDASVTVRDSANHTATANCANVVVQEQHQNDDNLTVTCRVSDTLIEQGDSVVYTADVSGGNGSITYDWNGDVSSSNKSFSKTYNNSGTYDASVTVRDSNGHTASDDCSNVVVDSNDIYDTLEITCRVSDTRIEEGDKVTFTADVDGGNSPYKYSWRGDISGSGRTKTYTFNNDGTYDVTVRVTDDEGHSATDDCSVVRVSTNNSGGTYSDSYSDYTTGRTASISSVFLNQIPYTGPADAVKGIGFIGLILAWSFSVAYLIRKKINRNATAKKIQEFKELNKQTQKI